MSQYNGRDGVPNSSTGSIPDGDRTEAFPVGDEDAQLEDATRNPDNNLQLDAVLGITALEGQAVDSINPITGSDGNKPRVYSAAVVDQINSTENDLKVDYAHPYYTTEGIPDQSSLRAESVVDADGNVTQSRLIIKDDTSKFFGDSHTRTYNTYTSTPYLTEVTVDGKNGGSSQDYKICASKVYAQHLFLGATVKSFNASLGWGAEASRVTVELVVDNCKYPNDLKDMNGLTPSELARQKGYIAIANYIENYKSQE